jgi:hypothetical protein
MLNEALDLLPQSKLLKLVKRYTDPSKLQSNGDGQGSLLRQAEAFEEASLAGQYYESFAVDSRNSTEKSAGTRAWIAECHRLLDLCVAQSKKGDPFEVRKAFDILFGLLDHIDECLDNIIFFADEPGSWQIGIDWEKVLPAWFSALSITAAPDEYAARITALLKHHYSYGSTRMLTIARKIATSDQRRALSSVVDRQAEQRPSDTEV